jgi:hypothetical protein
MQVDLLDVLRPHEHQYRVLCARQRFVLFIGGIGSGKTQCGAMWAVKKALEEPGSEGLIAGRRAEKDAVKLMWRRVKDVLEQLHEATGINWIRRYNRMENEAELLNGSRLIMRGFARDPDELRGPEYGWAWIDELSQAGSTLDPDYVFDVIDGRLRGGGGKHKQLLVTMTAKGLDPVARRFQAAQRRADQRYHVVKCTSYGNPFISRDDIDSWCASMSRRRVQQEIYCVLLRPSTVVWPEYDEGRHVVDIDVERARREGWQHVAGIDWGATRGNVCLEIRVHPRTKVWHVVDELVPLAADQPDGTLNRSKFRALLRDWWRERGHPDYVVTDRAIVAENNWLRNYLARHAPKTQHATMVSKTEQARESGMEMIRDALDPADRDSPRIVFARSLATRERGETPGIRPSMRGLAYATTRAGQPLGYVLDANPYRDATDALRYAWVGCRRLPHLHDRLPALVGTLDGPEDSEQ